MKIFLFEELGIPTAEGVEVGAFSGRVEFDTSGRETRVDWIELDGYTPDGKPKTIKVREGHDLYSILAPHLLPAFADDIAEQEANERGIVEDPYAEHRLSKAQLGLVS